MNTDKLLSFINEAEKFKTCLRTCSTSASGRQESDAEHSWHLALFLVLLKDELGAMDFGRVLELALVHDLPELYAGDVNPYRGDNSTKEHDEAKAAQRLFSLLDQDTGVRLGRLFQEYANQSTPEARVVKAADKLMPLIQNLCTNERHSSYRELKVRFSEAEEYMSPFFTDNGILRTLYEKLLAQARDQGVFHAAGGKE